MSVGPIPDALLRRLADSMAVGDTITFVTSAGRETIRAKDLFVGFLELRGAARAVLEWDASNDASEDVADLWERLRALLPKEPPRA